LAPREINKLKIIASALNNTPLKTKRIFIEGHADSFGDDDYNMALSQARAEHVSYLLNQSFLVENDRLSALGFGELYPTGDNATPEGRAKNRRVSLFIYNE
ncbi:MAG: OmpA family protein, partial [Pseudomonadales bacterium]|nr:OmpA family protein [Pseudomonadales bacterium]